MHGTNRLLNCLTNHGIGLVTPAQQLFGKIKKNMRDKDHSDKIIVHKLMHDRLKMIVAGKRKVFFIENDILIQISGVFQQGFNSEGALFRNAPHQRIDSA